MRRSPEHLAGADGLTPSARRLGDIERRERVDQRVETILDLGVECGEAREPAVSFFVVLLLASREVRAARFRLTAKLDHGAPAADQIEEEYDDRDDQQGMDQATAHVHRKTQEPEQKEDSNDGVQHDSLLVCSVCVRLSSLMILLERRRRWNPQVQGYLMQEAWIRGLAPCGVGRVGHCGTARARADEVREVGSGQYPARRAHKRVEVAIFATAGAEQSGGY
jgi:hypothetical protein